MLCPRTNEQERIQSQNFYNGYKAAKNLIFASVIQKQTINFSPYYKTKIAFAANEHVW